MTRKDYNLIAEAIRDARAKVAHESDNNPEVMRGANVALYELAVILSGRFFDDNPRFDDNRWMVATEVLHN
jgi:hypothetical protein